jgi:malate dehydrogenase (oxaloacetate-decarboxylating)
MNHDDIYTKSLELHKEHHGKLETRSKVKLDSREVLSLAYSPGVGAVSKAIAENKNLAKTHTLKHNTIAVISDGSAILGLGNLGALAAIPVMEGKAAIFKEFAGVDAFPICVHTQDTEEIIQLVKNISPVFGGINLEDISAPRCFEIEKRLRAELDIPVMHDDQWGAATVTLVGLINACTLRDISKKDAHIVIAGVGAAGVATARLLIAYGFTNITFVDSKGIITATRDDLTPEKKELLEASHNSPLDGQLADALRGAHVFIGLSKGNTVTQDMVRSMTERPILFTLSNPTPEIMPELAQEAGAYIVATGRGDYPNQINNSLVFPGAFKGILQVDSAQFEDGLFTHIAEAIVAHHAPHVSVDAILPSMFDAEIVKVVEKAVIEYFEKK